MPYDLKHITNFIFSYKDKYKDLSPEDKEEFFFILNRKFARKYPRHAKFLNSKSMDKSEALDIWYYFFIKERTNGTPDWYWFKKDTTTKTKSILKQEEVEYFLDFYDITPDDLSFLEKNYTD